MTKVPCINLEIGRFYQMKESIGPIPAGVYRLEDYDHGYLAFSVGRKRSVHFTVFLAPLNLFQEISLRLGKQTRTREREFALKYYRALREMPRNTGEGQAGKPITTCLVSDDVEAKYQMHLAEIDYSRWLDDVLAN